MSLRKYMQDKRQKIGIVLPTYNEAENIGHLLENIFKQNLDAAVLVVDDSPNDQTSTAAQQVISRLALSNPNVDYQIIKRAGGTGRASAVRAGFKLLAQREFDYVIEMDTDGSHPPEQLPELINTAIKESADIVICSRDLPGSKIIGWPIERKILHFLANFSCRVLLKLGIRDYMNAYRIYSQRAVKVTLEEAGKISTGFWAFGESLVQIKARQGKVKEIPTVFTNRVHGESKVEAKVIWGCLKELGKVYRLLCQLRSKKLSF